MNTLEEYTDVVVVGAGHAGCEGSTCLCKTRTFHNHFTVSGGGQHCTDAVQPEHRWKLQRVIW